MEYPCLYLLLVLAASLFSVRSECPSVQDIYPCECIYKDWRPEDIVCKNRDMTLNELKSVLSHFSKEKEIFSIELNHLTLGTIPSNLFEGISVYEIYIDHCEMDFENGKPPLKGLEDSLRGLYITSSLVQKNAPLYLKLGHLKELINLKIKNNTITELRGDMFDEEMPNLFTFELHGNLIEYIGENVFKNLTKLKYFELRGNKLGSLRRNMFPTPTQLINLFIDNNTLEDLPDDFFESMPDLRVLSLAKNKFKTLDHYTLKNVMEQLWGIDLRGNPLQCDSQMEWLFEKHVPRSALGTCAGPEGKAGLSLDEFLKKGKN